MSLLPHEISDIVERRRRWVRRVSCWRAVVQERGERYTVDEDEKKEVPYYAAHSPPPSARFSGGPDFFGGVKMPFFNNA